MRPAEVARKGDPEALLRWLEDRKPDPEFADLMDEVREASRKGLRLR